MHPERRHGWRFGDGDIIGYCRLRLALFRKAQRWTCETYIAKASVSHCTEVSSSNSTGSNLSFESGKPTRCCKRPESRHSRHWQKAKGPNHTSIHYVNHPHKCWRQANDHKSVACIYAPILSDILFQTTAPFEGQRTLLRSGSLRVARRRIKEWSSSNITSNGKFRDQEEKLCVLLSKVDQTVD